MELRKLVAILQDVAHNGYGVMMKTIKYSEKLFMYLKQVYMKIQY